MDTVMIARSDFNLSSFITMQCRHCNNGAMGLL